MHILPEILTKSTKENTINQNVKFAQTNSRKKPSVSPARDATSTILPLDFLSSGRKVLVTRMGPRELTS